MQVPTVPNQQAYQVMPTPSYNAVKIDINNPQVNAPGQQPQQAPITAPMYNYPQANVYEMPQKSVYEPQSNFNQPPTAKEMPSVPQPVIVPPVVSKPDAAPVVPAQAPAVEAAPQTVEVKAPEQATPAVDVNAFLGKLTNPDFEVQATAMEEIANLAQSSPDKATALLDVKVIDTLLGIMDADSSKLEGPTAQQLQIREKIIAGKPVTEAETAEANKISPMEQAERNKQYAIYTIAILEKIYGAEIEKINNTIVPLTELPGAAGIVEQVKNNPNPMVRASGIDALSYNQRPEYKQDLTTLFTIAQKDKDPAVQQAATKAIEKLNQASAAPAQAPIPEAAPAPQAEEAKKAA